MTDWFGKTLGRRHLFPFSLQVLPSDALSIATSLFTYLGKGLVIPGCE